MENTEQEQEAQATEEQGVSQSLMDRLNDRVNNVPEEKRRKIFWTVIAVSVAVIIIKLVISLVFRSEPVRVQRESLPESVTLSDSLTREVESLLDQEIIPSIKKDSNLMKKYEDIRLDGHIDGHISEDQQ